MVLGNQQDRGVGLGFDAFCDQTVVFPFALELPAVREGVDAMAVPVAVVAEFALEPVSVGIFPDSVTNRFPILELALETVLSIGESSFFAISLSV